MAPSSVDADVSIQHTCGAFAGVWAHAVAEMNRLPMIASKGFMIKTPRRRSFEKRSCTPRCRVMKWGWVDFPVAKGLTNYGTSGQ
jgi:hypothetical protein